VLARTNHGQDKKNSLARIEWNRCTKSPQISHPQVLCMCCMCGGHDGFRVQGPCWIPVHHRKSQLTPQVTREGATLAHQYDHHEFDLTLHNLNPSPLSCCHELEFVSLAKPKGPDLPACLSAQKAQSCARVSHTGNSPTNNWGGLVAQTSPSQALYCTWTTHNIHTHTTMHACISIHSLFKLCTPAVGDLSCLIC